MKIAFGCDHAAFEGPEAYKSAIIEHLESKGHEIVDCGTDGPESVDYPDFGRKVGEAITNGSTERGVLLCGTGIGIAIAANRISGIRAATCATPYMAKMAREHNDANVIALGRRVLTVQECLELIDIWLETPFNETERHKRRVEKMG